MNAPQAAGVLAEIAMLMEITGGDRFRAKAYANAARRVESSGADLAALAAQGKLTTLPGVGEGIGEVLRELVETGQSSLHARLAAETPIGLYDVMRIKGLGASRIRTLYAELGVDSLDRLEAAALAGRVARLPGFGEKTEQLVLSGIAFARAARGRRRLPHAEQAADDLLEAVRALEGVSKAEIAGEVRRRLEVVESIEIVAASRSPQKVLAVFRAIAGSSSSEDEAGNTAEIRLSDGLVARLTCVTSARWGTALLRATGSDEHLAQLAARAESQRMRFGADGLFRGETRVRAADEAAVYRALGLAWVPPELREGWGEVEAAAEGRLPALVELEDLRGTFHCHTTYSDGKATLEEMAEAARGRGWSYLGIADHSRSAGYAGGLPPEKARRQQRAIDAWNRAHGGKGKGRFRLFKGVESDILADGSLDYDDDVLDGFDYVVGSVHSGFGMPGKEMTARIIRAVSNPRLTILGHATGRLILRRDAYDVDVEAVIDAAAAHGVAVEINADPARLDVDWKNARYAAERGVLVPVNPDAHSTAALDVVYWGVGVARKAWLTKRQVLNARELEEVEDYFAERKQARPG
jgi:DNA polymerase (family 10)